jgi:hypothetical protein
MLRATMTWTTTNYSVAFAIIDVAPRAAALVCAIATTPQAVTFTSAIAIVSRAATFASVIIAMPRHWPLWPLTTLHYRSSQPLQHHFISCRNNASITSWVVASLTTTIDIIINITIDITTNVIVDSRPFFCPTFVRSPSDSSSILRLDVLPSCALLSLSSWALLSCVLLYWCLVPCCPTSYHITILCLDIVHPDVLRLIILSNDRATFV